MRGPVEVRVDTATHPVVVDDILKPVIESIQRDQGHRIVAIGQQSADMLERIQELERDNRRLRDIVDVEIREFYDRMRIARLEACARRHLGYRQCLTHDLEREGVNEQSDRRMAEALRARDAVRNLEPLMRDEGEQEEVNRNGGNGKGGNGNEEIENGGNRNGGNGRWSEMEMELVLLCTRMVPSEEDKVERFVGGLPNNIQGNMIAAEPTQLQDAIRTANNLMDQKLKEYARRLCTVRCGNCKRVGHMTRDCKVTVTPNTQRAPVGNQHVALLDVAPSTLDSSYAIELADRRISETNIVLRDEVVQTEGDDYDGRSKSKLNIISCTKTQKYMEKGCQVYLAQVTSKKNEDKSEEKRLEDVPIVQEFAEVFQKTAWLPPARQ
ncbi:putative reverse transcriptase domain-containing protein [Tanacetum coccineum]